MEWLILFKVSGYRAGVSGGGGFEMQMWMWSDIATCKLWGHVTAWERFGKLDVTQDRNAQTDFWLYDRDHRYGDQWGGRNMQLWNPQNIKY